MAVTQTQPKQSEAKLLAVEDDANTIELLSPSLRFAGLGYVVRKLAL